MGKMKIMFICSNLRSGGAERTIAYLANGFSKTDEVAICSYQNDIFYHISKDVLIKTSDFDSSKNIGLFNRLYNYLKIKAFVKKTIKNFEPDVVVSLLTSNVRHLPKKKTYALITSERSNPLFCNDKKEIARKMNAFSISDGIVFQDISS